MLLAKVIVHHLSFLADAFSYFGVLIHPTLSIYPVIKKFLLNSFQIKGKGRKKLYRGKVLITGNVSKNSEF